MRHAIDCLAEILDSFADGQIEQVEDLATILHTYGFIDEDNELTRKGHEMFIDTDNTEE